MKTPIVVTRCQHSSITINKNGGSGIIDVTAPASCPWIATSNYPEWITVSNGGNGSGSVNYTIAPSNGQTRPGSIVIANQLVKVLQSSPVGTGIFDDANVNWVYSGNWTSSSNLSGPYSGTISHSNDSTAKAAIQIEGTAFRLEIHEKFESWHSSRIR
jgi:hypothetical protein